jgi:hypothetical protein
VPPMSHGLVDSASSRIAYRGRRTLPRLLCVQFRCEASSLQVYPNLACRPCGPMPVASSERSGALLCPCGGSLDALYGYAQFLRHLGRRDDAIRWCYTTLQAHPRLLDVTGEILGPDTRLGFHRPSFPAIPSQELETLIPQERQCLVSIGMSERESYRHGPMSWTHAGHNIGD